MSVKRTNGKIGKVFAYVFLLLVIAAIIGFIVHFTNGFTSDFATFYVQVDDTMYTDIGVVELQNYEPVRFETKYTFKQGNEKHRGYNMKIVPNITDETNFDFTVDGKVFSFAGESDFSKVFDIKRDEVGFEIINKKLSMEKILQSMYAYKNVAFDCTFDMENKIYFNLVVSSYNEKQEIVIGLRLPPPAIEFDKDGIVI